MSRKRSGAAVGRLRSRSSFASLLPALTVALGILTGACRGDAKTFDRGDGQTFDRGDGQTLDRGDTPAPGYIVLEGSAQALRSEFNADSGLVRAILLASPT